MNVPKTTKISWWLLYWFMPRMRGPSRTVHGTLQGDGSGYNVVFLISAFFLDADGMRADALGPFGAENQPGVQNCKNFHCSTKGAEWRG
jgi:hypothetical protein